MNKAAIYLSFLFVIIFGVVFYQMLPKKTPQYSTEGVVYYDNLSKEDLISNVTTKNVFIIPNKNKTVAHLYRVGDYQGDGKYRLYKTEVPWNKDKYWVDIANAVKEEIIYSDTLKAIGSNEIREIIYQADKVEGARISEPEDYQGAFDFIDNTVFIFFAIALLWFLGLLLLELIIFLGQWIFKKDFTNIIYAICLLVGIRFIQIGVAPMTYPEVEWQVLLWPVILLLPIYLIYQYFFRWRKLELEKADLEALKFISLIVGIIVFNLLGLHLMKWVFRNDDVVTFSFGFNMSMGMACAFALGNLLFNGSKHLWSMRGAGKKLVIASANEEQSKAALNTLQSSVNPHFLYNALNSIAALAKVDPERTEKMTLALSEFYKYNTNREGNEMSTVHEEMEMLRTYLKIEKIRFKDRLLFEFRIPENVKDVQIPHFLLQPIVENAIKYGYDKSTDTITVRTEVDRLDNGLEIKIYDDGIPFSDEMQKGFGLKSVTNKLQLFYPAAHEVFFVNLPKKHVSILLKEIEK